MKRRRRCDLMLTGDEAELIAAEAFVRRASVGHAHQQPQPLHTSVAQLLPDGDDRVAELRAVGSKAHFADLRQRNRITLRRRRCLAGGHRVRAWARRRLDGGRELRGDRVLWAAARTQLEPGPARDHNQRQQRNDPEPLHAAARAPRRGRGAVGAEQPHQFLKIAVPALIGQHDRLSPRQRAQRRRHRLGGRHRRAVHEHGDHHRLPRQAGADLAAHQVVGVVDAPLARSVDGARPARADHRQHTVGARQRLIQRVHKVLARPQIAHVHEDTPGAEALGQAVLQPASVAGAVIAPVADEDALHGGHANPSSSATNAAPPSCPPRPRASHTRRARSAPCRAPSASSACR